MSRRLPTLELAIDRSVPPQPDDRRPARRTAAFDFRRPSKVGRDVLRVFELGHETFVRRLSTAWGSELRSIVSIEPMGMEQLSYDDHVRSMPNPNVVLVVAGEPLPGVALVDCNVQLALGMVDRLLGAAPVPGVRPPRRPSEVETDLVRFLGRHAAEALADTLSLLLDTPVDSALTAVEFNPQLVQVAAPSDPTLLLSYRVTVSGGLDASGFVTVAYPAPMLLPLLEQVSARRAVDAETPTDGHAKRAMSGMLHDVVVSLGVQLDATAIPAVDLASLQVGDVLRLEHRVDVPARGVVGGEEVLRAHLGRRGRRLAAQVRAWTIPAPDVVTETPAPTHSLESVATPIES